MTCRARALLRRFAAQLGPLEDVGQSDTPWHSATFIGARYSLSFIVDPAVDMAAFAKCLPEADIPIPGGFVADALVTGIDGTRVSIEVLTIDAA